MKNQRCSTLLLLLGWVLMVCGCLQQQQTSPVPPALDTSLSSVIRQALDEDREAHVALANQVALTNNEADQRKLWVENHDKISTKSATIIMQEIHKNIYEEDGKTLRNSAELSDVWKEVAKGYGTR